MRKVLPILLAIAIAAPALADVTVSVSDAGSETAQIALAIDGGAVVRGVALKVTITGAELAAIADVTDVMAAFNAYIDYYYSNPGFFGGLADETALPGTGAHALADPDAAGVLATLPANTFVISLGALDNSGNQGGVTAGGLLCKIKLSNFAGTSAQVCIEPDALRGGIVGDNLGTVSATACADIAVGVLPCRERLTAAEKVDYDAYVAAGKDPSCWCWQFQCHGDVDNATETALKYRIYNADIAAIVANWKAKITTANPCADIDHAAETALKYRVYNADIAKVVANWKKKDSALTSCPGYVAP